MTTFGSGPTMCVIAAGLVCSGLALILLNPPIRSAEELAAPGAKVLAAAVAHARPAHAARRRVRGRPSC